MESLKKGVLAARGFQAGAGHAGIKNGSQKDDVALIFCEVPCKAAGVFTRNQVKADCVKISREHLNNLTAQAIIANSGNANAAAPNGKQAASRMAAAAAKKFGIDEQDVVVASTGVIGQELPVEKIEMLVPEISLSDSDWQSAAAAIMTTDTVIKEASTSFEIDGIQCFIGGVCKGSGMIHPNMGTMLSFITTDVNISDNLLEKALQTDTKTTFNRISVDQDTSTNDMCILLSSCLAGNPEITEENENYQIFLRALHEVMESLAVQIASDGEGATRCFSVHVDHAASEEDAEELARSVVTSSLVKAAMFGADANCGRILCALGYSPVSINPDTIDVSYKSQAGQVMVCQDGLGLVFDEDLAAAVLKEPVVEILVDMHAGNGSATCWGCDLSYDYVKINGDYRT